MVAGECKGIAKVGGLGDVVHDLSRALKREGVDVTIVLPAYGSVTLPSSPVHALDVNFGGRTRKTRVVRYHAGDLTVLGIESPEFFEGAYGSVYVDSSATGLGPFEDDAARFAFFSAAVAALLEENRLIQSVDALHCHDWHTGTLLALARLTNRYPALGTLRTLFTIHNLDYQGTRPLRGSDSNRLSSLESWFPELFPEFLLPAAKSRLLDPGATDCYNPMRAGIRLADMVTTVSPNYAGEITRPDAPERNFVGGRGLEADLASLAREGRLRGMLNGIDYHEHSPQQLRPAYSPASGRWQELRRHHKKKVRTLLLDLLNSGADDVAGRPERLDDERAFLDRFLLVAVTRMARQKMSLLMAPYEPQASVLEALLRLPLNLVVLGTGELLEPMQTAIRTASTANAWLLGRFDPLLARQLYAGGDAFLMPSDFEPCGISQLIAMSYGTLPIATAVGGLADTIDHGQTGFLVAAPNRAGLADALIRNTRHAASIYANHHDEWARRQQAAMSQRFTWQKTARAYVQLYGLIR